MRDRIEPGPHFLLHAPVRTWGNATIEPLEDTMTHDAEYMKLQTSHEKLLKSLEWTFGIVDVMLDQCHFIRAMNSLNVVAEPNRSEAREAIKEARKL